MRKIIIDWEDIDLSDIIREHGHRDEYDDYDEQPRSVGEMLIDKYLERQHNFHILNTNFNLSVSRCRKLALITGVERFTPLSRYKAMVNIAKLFDVNEVKEKVKTTINKFFYIENLGQENEAS